jgi:hypothetical protein
MFVLIICYNIKYICKTSQFTYMSIFLIIYFCLFTYFYHYILLLCLITKYQHYFSVFRMVYSWEIYKPNANVSLKFRTVDIS